jgi:RHS repeat-associated protein
MLNRGWCGHEHLPFFGLVNMNARLYDPILGRFLSPDPYIQAPNNPANFNRYTYCLNNPLKYTDEDGEWIHIVIGAALGGIGNLIANWNNCNGFWQYVAAFGVGAITGAAVAATGGAVAAAGTTAWGVVANIGVGVLSGAANGATNDIIRQTGKNFYGMENVDWTSVGISAAASGVAGGVSTGVGMSLAGINASLTINGITIKSPLVTSFAEGAMLGGVGHVVGGTTAGLLSGNDPLTALHDSFNGLGSSMLMGGAFAAASTAAHNWGSKLLEARIAAESEPITAKDLGLEGEVARINKGEKYGYRDDSSTYHNNNGHLPSGVKYTEYYTTPTGAPGTNRIVVGNDGNWYFTPDHYETFIQFKP